MHTKTLTPTSPHFFSPHFTASHHTMLCHTTPHYTTPYRTTPLYYNIPHHTTPHHTTPLHIHAGHFHICVIGDKHIGLTRSVTNTGSRRSQGDQHAIASADDVCGHCSAPVIGRDWPAILDRLPLATSHHTTSRHLASPPSRRFRNPHSSSHTHTQRSRTLLRPRHRVESGPLLTTTHIPIDACYHLSTQPHL